MLPPDEMFERLAAPFDPDAISWRVGSTNINKQTNEPYEGKEAQGLALAYLDARDVMDRFDLVCGPGGWQCRYPHANGKTVCEIGVRVPLSDPNEIGGPEWIWKADGAGDTDVEAEKGALSDAFKRAAVRWGVGRYLYSLPSPWVKLEKKGRTWIIKQPEYSKLRKLLTDYSANRKSSARSIRDKDFEFFKEKLEQARDMEELGAIGREIKVAIPTLPLAFREPLQDAYLKRREELTADPLDDFREPRAEPLANGNGHMAAEAH